MSMFAEERQQAMARHVAKHGRLSVNELADLYDITTETVRRDLTALERLGMVRRVHGGAVPAGALTALESALVERDTVNTGAKERIALSAVSLLSGPTMSVIFDAGSTTARVAGSLPADIRITAFTHALPIASRLSALPQVEVHLLPGRVRATTQAAVGVDTVAALDHLRVDIAYIGTNALSARGLSTPDPDEAATKRALVGSARQVVLLADQSKLGPDTAVRFAELADVDVLITDGEPPSDFATALSRADVKVVIA